MILLSLAVIACSLLTVGFFLGYTVGEYHGFNKGLKMGRSERE